MPVLTPIPNELHEADQEEFKGFTYIADWVLAGSTFDEATTATTTQPLTKAGSVDSSRAGSTTNLAGSQTNPSGQATLAPLRTAPVPPIRTFSSQNHTPVTASVHSALSPPHMIPSRSSSTSTLPFDNLVHDSMPDTDRIPTPPAISPNRSTHSISQGVGYNGGGSRVARGERDAPGYSNDSDDGSETEIRER
jgi:hypothetical protein